MTAEALDLIFNAPTEHVLDARLRALIKANEFWRLSAMSERPEKLGMAAELHKEALFSLNQLAKIVRLPVPSVARVLQKNAPGGRFVPESLRSLTYMRRVVLGGERIPMHMVRVLYDEGTSISEISRLTGAPETSMYLFIKNTQKH